MFYTCTFFFPSVQLEWPSHGGNPTEQFFSQTKSTELPMNKTAGRWEMAPVTPWLSGSTPSN